MADIGKDKSNSSSFEDLSNIPAAELNESAGDAPADLVPKQQQQEKETESEPADAQQPDGVIDIIGNGQLVKKVRTTNLFR